MPSRKGPSREASKLAGSGERDAEKLRKTPHGVVNSERLEHIFVWSDSARLAAAGIPRHRTNPRQLNDGNGGVTSRWMGVLG